MAYVKKEKAVTTPKEEVVLNTSPEVEVLVEEVTPKVAPKAAPRKVEVDRDAMVACRSVVSGEMAYTSRKTHQTVEWADYGVTEYVDVGELITMKSSQPRFLTDPWIIIEDEDVVEYLGLKHVYDKIIPTEDIESFLLYTNLPDMEESLKAAPKGMKELVIDKAREMIAAETLYDVRVMRLLDRVLNIDLTMIQA